ncbi:MAG: hypothetical protein Q7S40_34485 [Opitutaceae bacterium]|nr:hypothetical protein [Opitutaceae bacterium]
MQRALSLLLFALPAGVGIAAQSHLDFRRDALAAYDRKDYPAARDAFAAALKLRPDSPRYLHSLAAMSAMSGDKAAAFRLLEQLADLGVATAIERDPNLASLQAEPEFLRILRRFAENRSAQGEAEVVAEMPGRTGIIEGIAFRPRTADIFLGDVHLRGIWRRDRTGQITRFSAEDEELLGIFGLAIDEARNTLWAAMSALPEMSDFAADLKGQAGLAEFNLSTGDLRRVIPVPSDGRDHVLADLLVAENGIVYATDSLAPVIWQLSPGDEEMVKLAESKQFMSLQGLVIVQRMLIVSDYNNGLFAVDLKAGEHGRSADEAIRAFTPPPNATLLGIDGLVAVPGGIAAVQNGVTPQRIIRIVLSPDLQSITAVEVLASAVTHLEDLSLVTLMNDRPTFIAGAGWEGFDPAKSARPAAHAVRIMQVALP